MTEPTIHRYRTIILQPHWLQFVIAEFPLILLTTALFGVAGLEAIPIPNIFLCMAGLSALNLLYR